MTAISGPAITAAVLNPASTFSPDVSRFMGSVLVNFAG
jgi:hypothetical protein